VVVWYSGHVGLVRGEQRSATMKSSGKRVRERWKGISACKWS
jgi:hypothetical protein